MSDKTITLPNGGFVTYLNANWYEVYKITIDEYSGDIDFLDEYGHPRGGISYQEASEIIVSHYIGETEIDTNDMVFVLVKNGKVVI